MQTIDFSSLNRSLIGFDRLARIMEARQLEAAPSYPPYNIELVSEDSYQIVMALAGFSPSEVEIVAEGEQLRVAGRKAKEVGEKRFLHRGIASRDFDHRFQIADHVKVTGASFDNGMLTIALVREVPEALKPRRIEIVQRGQAAVGTTPLENKQSHLQAA